MNINENHGRSESQVKRILAYLLDGNSITGLDALKKFGCMRLPARISDIKARGYLVYSEFVTGPNGKKYKKYYL